MDFKEIGKRLKELRKEKKLSLEKLGELTDIDASMLSRYENGKTKKNGMLLYNIVQIAIKLETSLDYIVFGKGPKVVYYKTRNDDDFGTNFVKSISFLFKNFPTYITENSQENNNYNCNDNGRYIFSLYLYNKLKYDFFAQASKIRNLYINGDEDESKHFKKYEGEILNKIALEINKEYEKFIKDIEDENKK